MLYTLRTESPVKWTFNQEKTICQDYPWSHFSSETAAEYVVRTYAQFLWLPESIMPLRRLALALSRVSSLFPEEFASSSSSGEQTHPLHALLKPCLLTTRSAADKWNTTVPRLLENEENDGSSEHEVMWFSLKYEKVEEPPNAENSDDTEEKWRANWLQRMEQREVMIQIILYFLLLSLPGPPEPLPASPKVHSIDAPAPSPKKRKRGAEDLRPLPLDDRLEAFMDRLSMWQLMGTIEETAGGDESLLHTRSAGPEKGKKSAADERDWMQKFCEDVVKPVFEESMPDLCELLHSKVFQSSPFSDDSDPFSPPPSPKAKSRRPLERSSSTTTVTSQSSAQAVQSRTLSRTNSLSMSLQEERVRERSKSLSVGPGNMRRRVLTREVSMSTAFKGKTKPPAASRASVSRDKDKEKEKAKMKRQANVSSMKGALRDQGVTLVEATPSQQKIKALPSMLSSSRMAVEGDDDDDDWFIEGSPEILLLEPDDGEDDESAWQEATPTKRPKVKRFFTVRILIGAMVQTEVAAPPSENRGSLENIPPETLQFARRMFNAARSGDLVLLQAVDAGLPVDLTNDEGNTLLMLATYHGHVELSEGLISRGADVNRVNDRGQSPLAGAVFKGYDKVVQILKDAGADPRSGTPSAIQTARMFNKADVLKMLGANEEDMRDAVPLPPSAPR
ncbi:hypothetical protein NM688_g6259 [Phlebia brevispora]|uniref:Uncharacterized protein n=1 Tax=Phlebia brevispora TaxID=194682 RepID=A0ACC1SHZ2_9APHY|nr:hypothetical protein NM688_g6259 [Phlebia brevispora]